MVSDKTVNFQCIECNAPTKALIDWERRNMVTLCDNGHVMLFANNNRLDMVIHLH